MQSKGAESESETSAKSERRLQSKSLVRVRV